MILTPDRYAEASVYDLLEAVAAGHAGLDRRVLRAIIERAEPPVGEIVRFGLESLKNRRRIELADDLIAILLHLNVPEALPYFLELIRSEPDDVPDEIVNAVIAIGPPAVEPLLKLYEELGEERGGDVAFMLSAIGVRDERILTLLTERLEYDADDAAIDLGIYSDPAALPALRKVAGEVDAAAQAIAEIEAGGERSGPEDTEFDLWEDYPEQAQPDFGVLSAQERLEFLTSPLAEHRAAAVESFFNEDLDDELSERILQLARNDPEPAVRARAWETLYGSLEKPGVRKAMLDRLHEPSVPVEEQAGLIVGLSEIVPEPEVRPHLLQLYDDPKTRAKALEAMWRSTDRRFAEYFPPNLDAEDDETRRQAIWGAGRLGIGSEAGRLRALFDNDEFRSDALFAYSLAVPANVSRARMKTLFRKIEDLAGGLSEYEAGVVEAALDERLMLHGFKPVFHQDDAWIEEHGDEVEDRVEQVVSGPKVGRNDPCPCGSGKKYKKCCGK